MCERSWVHFHLPIAILYEDNHLLVIEKPCNLPTQADDSKDPDLLSILKADLKQRFAKPGEAYLGLVHRLDRPAGGVMVFAKTSKAASRLSAAIREHQWEKRYVAVVHGRPRARSGMLHHWLSKQTIDFKITVVPKGTPDAHEATLEYEVLDTSASENLSLVKITLQTGRKHQIRVQFAAQGHPLWGDQRYGKSLNRVGQQLALWSSQITCQHPTRNETLVFRSSPPAQFPWSLWPSL